MNTKSRGANADALVPYGWSDRWVALLAEHPGTEPARVARHDGTALQLVTPDGVVVTQLTRRLDPAPTVGDWVACEDGEPVAVLPRASLLRRRSAGREIDQSLAANIDLVLLVCGLDRPIKPGRIHRGATLAWDAGAVPVAVLTKAALADDAESISDRVGAENPGVDVLVTSALEGIGLDALRELARGRTLTMLGESGAGKSSLVNALMGEDVADTGPVREGDSRGRHTTTFRELHLLPTGGVLIDTPGIRSVGLWGDPEALSETFADIDDLAPRCRFTDCHHGGEPGCAVLEAVEAGRLPRARLDAWIALQREAESMALRAVPYEQRRRDKEFARVAKAAARRKGRDGPPTRGAG